jgi:hypothetical protein
VVQGFFEFWVENTLLVFAVFHTIYMGFAYTITRRKPLESPSLYTDKGT